jgi:hypothetical protein
MENRLPVLSCKEGCSGRVRAGRYVLRPIRSLTILADPGPAGYCLKISNQHVRSLFNSVIDRAMALVNERLRRANAALQDRGLRVSVVLPAGGFSLCPLIQERVSRRRRHGRPCPRDPTVTQLATDRTAKT